MSNTIIFKNAINHLKDLNLLSDSTTICLKTNQATCLITAVCADFNNFSDKDLLEVTINILSDDPRVSLCSKIFEKKKDVTTIIIANPPALTSLSSLNIKIPPILDDFAQIIGPTMKTIEDASDVLSGLRNRGGCMLKDKGVIVIGRSLDEGVTALLVAEKTAKTYTLAKSIGGAVPIPMWEAILMNFVYKKKYSKISKKQ